MSDLEHRVITLEHGHHSLEEYLRRQDKHNEKMEMFMEDIKKQLGAGDGRFLVIEQRVKQAEEDIDNIGRKYSDAIKGIYGRMWAFAGGTILLLIGFFIWYIQSIPRIQK